MDIEAQTDFSKRGRLVSPVVTPILQAPESIWKYDVAKITSHSDCGIGSYIFVNRKTRSVTPITQAIDIEGFTGS